MAELVLPERAIFNQKVNATSQRIQSISSSNTMAKLLYSNFQNWLSTSAISPVALTQKLDADANQYISGQEFSSLLKEMTGDRPPDWVVQTIFSFVDANPKTGIPLTDWMAFLAACGIQLPDELFTPPFVLTGSLVISTEEVVSGETIGVTISLNGSVDEYTLIVTNISSGITKTFVTRADEMDSALEDEFTLELETEGLYSIELLHQSIRLDKGNITVLAKPIPEEDSEVEPESEEENIAQENIALRDIEASTESFSALVAALELTKLRSEAQQIIDMASLHEISFTVLFSEQTLLAQEGYRGGKTLTCKHKDGFEFEVVMVTNDNVIQVGDRLTLTAQPYEWSVARKHLVCKESPLG